LKKRTLKILIHQNKLNSKSRKLNTNKYEIIKYIKNYQVYIFQNKEKYYTLTDINTVIDDVGQIHNVFSKIGQTYKKKK